jgi:hypothetical protein
MPDNKEERKHEKEERKKKKKEERQERIDDHREWTMTKPRPLRDILQALAIVFENGPAFFMTGRTFLRSIMIAGGVGLGLFVVFKWLAR